MTFVHDEGMKALLPQMTLPVLTTVDESGILAMNQAKEIGETAFGFRHCNQMHVIGHQAISPKLDADFQPCLSQETQIEPIIMVGEKRLLSTIAPLRNVVWVTWDNQSRHPGQSVNPS